MSSPEAARNPLLAPGSRLLALTATAAALLGGLSWGVRPWYLTWGATPEEISAPLPGDAGGIVPHQTRAIAIAAPAEHVFAWVAQIGQDRGGFYSYELLEDLVGCEMPDVRHLDPELQRWNVGDRLWMYPPHKLDGLGHATLMHYSPGRALVFGTHAPLDPPEAAPSGTWSLLVEPTGPASSRLIARASGAASTSLLGNAFNRTVFEPLHFAMERRMLEGIAALAEGRSISEWRDRLQLSSWAASFAALVAALVLVALGSHWRRRLAAFASAGVVFQIVTLLQPNPLVGFALTSLPLVLLWPPRRERPPAATPIEPELEPAGGESGRGEPGRGEPNHCEPNHCEPNHSEPTLS